MTRRPERGSPWLVVAGVIGLAFVAGMVVGSWGTSAAPRQPLIVSATGDGSDTAQPQPTIQLVIVWPSPTVTATSTPKPTPQPTATAQPVCGNDTAFGDVCVMVKPTIRQPKTFVWCTPEWSGLCRWPGPDTVSAKVETE